MKEGYRHNAVEELRKVQRDIVDNLPKKLDFADPDSRLEKILEENGFARKKIEVIHTVRSDILEFYHIHKGEIMIYTRESKDIIQILADKDLRTGERFPTFYEVPKENTDIFAKLGEYWGSHLQYRKWVRNFSLGMGATTAAISIISAIDQDLSGLDIVLSGLTGMVTAPVVFVFTSMINKGPNGLGKPVAKGKEALYEAIEPKYEPVKVRVGTEEEKHEPTSTNPLDGHDWNVSNSDFQTLHEDLDAGLKDRNGKWIDGENQILPTQKTER